MTSFADSYQHQELLNISKKHLDALDLSLVRNDAIIGGDNLANLMVATVFAAVAIEAAMNDYVLHHRLLLGRPYLQRVFGEIMAVFLRGSVFRKIALLYENRPTDFPDKLRSDVRRLFEIRNRIVHQTGEFLPGDTPCGDDAEVRNRPLTNDEMQHMRRHHEVANDFLSRFWLPGAQELGALPHVDLPQ